MDIYNLFSLRIAYFILISTAVLADPAQKSVLKRTTTLTNIQEVFKKFTMATKGKGTYYGDYPVGSGACSLDPLSPVYTQKGWITVAAGNDIFHKSLGCGTCLEVTGEGVGSGNNPIKGVYKAVVVDLCGCSPGLDFFIPGDGKWDIRYKAIDCPTVPGKGGDIIFRMKGSNPWYLKIQVTNSRLPTASFEIFRNDKWYCAKRSPDNHFIINGLGEIKFPLKVRVTSVAGETLGAEIAALSDSDIQTKVQYKPFMEVNDGKPPKLGCYGQDDKNASNDNDDEDEKTFGDEEDNNATQLVNDEAQKETNEEKDEKPGKETPEKKPESVHEDTTDSKEWCKDNNKPDGTYADPFDCTGFIQCAQGNTYRKKCPSGLRFNPKIMNCDKTINVQCDNNRRHYIQENKLTQYSMDDEPTPVLSPQSWCSRHQKKDGFYEDQSDCSGFIHCFRGRAFIKKCPPEKLFSSKTASCDFSHLVDCSPRTGVPNTSKVETGTGNTVREGGSDRTTSLSPADKEGKVVVDSSAPVKTQGDSKMGTELPGNATSLRKDDADSLTKLRLPDALRGIASKIEKGEMDNAATEPGSVEQDANSGGMTEDGTPVFANASNSNFCSGKFDGRYYVPEKCEYFYVCSRGRTYIGKCPSSLKFNVKLNTCDVPAKVQCKKRLSESTATYRYIEQLNSFDKKHKIRQRGKA